METLKEKQQRAGKMWRERWSERLAKQGRRMEEMDLISTDIGFISVDNLNYLHELNLLNEDGSPTKTKEKNEMVYTWSKLCEVFGFVSARLKEEANVNARIMPDDVVTCMRLGSVKIPYREKGRDYVQKYENPLSGGFGEQYAHLRKEADERLKAKTQGRRKASYTNDDVVSE